MRSLAYGHHRDRHAVHGYEPTREAAMARREKLAAGNEVSGRVTTSATPKPLDVPAEQAAAL